MAEAEARSAACEDGPVDQLVEPRWWTAVSFAVDSGQSESRSDSEDADVRSVPTLILLTEYLLDGPEQKHEHAKDL